MDEPPPSIPPSLPPRPVDPSAGKWCGQCRYPLRGLPSPGDCPECGKPFDFAKPWTYAVDEVRRWRFRISWQRVKALFGAAALVAIGELLGRDWGCFLFPLYPAWVVIVVVLAFVAIGPIGMSVASNFLLGAAIGGLIFGPIGAVFGSAASFYAFHLELLGYRND